MKNWVLLFLLLGGQSFLCSLYAQDKPTPYVEAQSNINVGVLGVETGDVTKIDLFVINFHKKSGFKYWFNPKGSEKAFYIENPETGQRYEYLGEEYPSSKNNPHFLEYEGIDTVTLSFEKIPNSLTKFNLIEGVKNNSWDFRGIDLNRAYRNPMNSLVGKNCFFNETLPYKINWLLSEYYNFRMHGAVEKIEEGVVTIRVTKTEIVDPSYASVNYLNYREAHVEHVKKSVGDLFERNVSEVNFKIW